MLVIWSLSVDEMTQIYQGEQHPDSPSATRAVKLTSSLEVSRTFTWPEMSAFASSSLYVVGGDMMDLWANGWILELTKFRGNEWSGQELGGCPSWRRIRCLYLYDSKSVPIFCKLAPKTFCLIFQHLPALMFDVAFAGVEWRYQPKLNSRTLDSSPKPLLRESARSVEL